MVQVPVKLEMPTNQLCTLNKHLTIFHIITFSCSLPTNDASKAVCQYPAQKHQTCKYIRLQNANTLILYLGNTRAYAEQSLWERLFSNRVRCN